MDYYAIGQRVRKIRKAQGISQEWLAELADISVTHMSHIETGNTKLSLPVLVKLAQALQVRTDDLLYDANPAGRSALIDATTELLDDCSIQQLKIIERVVKATKQALDQYL